MRSLINALFVVMAILVTNNFACAQFGCGSPGTGDCCAPNGNGTPYCEDAACCDMVCEIDPYCCNTEWDLNCATTANKSCSCGTGGPDCGDENAGDCCVPNGTPTCNNLKCCKIVCAIDYFCCINEWDQICAESALIECNDCGSGEEFGACCLGSGDCEWTTLTSCNLMGGEFSAGIDCAIADCGPTGACCLPTGCQEGMTSNACLLAGGVWAGEATTCEDVKCILEVGPDSQFQTIQAAVDAATDGDTIHVYPGTYTQLGDDQVVMIEKSLTIEGVGDGEVIIDGVHESRGFLVVATKSSGKTNTYLTIRNVLFKNCKAVGIDFDQNGDIDTWEKSGGGALIRGAYTIRFDDCDISDCEAPDGDGGAIAGYVDVDGPMAGFQFKIEITDSVLNSNQAKNGGAIKFGGASEFKLNNSSLENNRASEDGGAIDLDCPWHVPGISTIRIEGENNQFRNNEADDDGGALELDRIGICGPDSPGDDDGGAFNGPDCEDGLVPVEVIFKDLFFENNHADADDDGEGDGGAIRFRDYERVTIEDTEFHDNSAAYGGGVKYLLERLPGPSKVGVPVFINGKVVNCVSSRCGGGLSFERETVARAVKTIIGGTEFRGNRAGAMGGAVDVKGRGEGEVQITNATFENNKAGVGDDAEGAGGGVNVDGARKVEVEGSEFSGNSAGVGTSAQGRGGGMSVRGILDELKVTLSDFLENEAGVGEEAQGTGGGIDLEGPGGGQLIGEGTALIQACSIRNNSAGLGGGIRVAASFVAPQLTDTTVCENAVGQIEGAFTDGGGNTIGEECSAECPADINGDGLVDGGDLGSMLAAWGACPECPEDLTGDGLVDGGDLGLLLAAFGLCDEG